MIKLITKKPGCDPEVIEFGDSLCKSNIEALIGCDTTDRVYLDQERELVLYVDDVGHYRNLPLNFKMKTVHFPVLPILGTVVVARIKIIGDDYDFVSVTDNDFSIFNDLLQRSGTL